MNLCGDIDACKRILAHPWGDAGDEIVELLFLDDVPYIDPETELFLIGASDLACQVEASAGLSAADAADSLLKAFAPPEPIAPPENPGYTIATR